MIKEITVAGIKLNNYTALENLSRIGKNIDNNAFIAIQEVYMRTLLLAQEDDMVKKALEMTDVTVVSEVGILDAVGQTTIFQKHEIERREFFFQLMKILERSKFTVFILGDEEKEVEQAVSYISGEFPRLQIAGAEILGENPEDVVNEINLQAPKAIISVLASPLQEKFFVENRAMLSAKIWYGMGSGKFAGQKHSLKYIFLEKMRKLKLMYYVRDYKEEVEDRVEELEDE